MKYLVIEITCEYVLEETDRRSIISYDVDDLVVDKILHLDLFEQTDDSAIISYMKEEFAHEQNA